MACSDNVVRAGLTPKYQDVDTLVSMLEYGMVSPESRKFEGFKMDEYTTLYNPPVPDFAVDMIEVRISLCCLPDILPFIRLVCPEIDIFS